MTGGLLPGVDADLVRPLAARLQKRFRKILLNTKVAKVSDRGDRAFEPAFAAEDVADARPEAVFDKVLVAVGRRPNSANLGTGQGRRRRR